MVYGPEGLAQVVPDAPAARSYIVSCSASGRFGLFTTCADAVCSRAETTTPFTSGQCVPNPPQYGASSVVFRCGPGGSIPDADVLNAMNGFRGPAPLTGGGGGRVASESAPSDAQRAAAQVGVAVTALGAVGGALALRA